MSTSSASNVMSTSSAHASAATFEAVVGGCREPVSRRSMNPRDTPERSESSRRVVLRDSKPLKETISS